jgi:phage/plasmid-associated DNA primase
MVKKIFLGDEPLMDYARQVAGLAAGGRQGKDFLVAFGPTANNGKSLFFETLARALGDFAATVDAGLFMRQLRGSPGAARQDLLRLNGVRLALTDEADPSD